MQIGDSDNIDRFNAYAARAFAKLYRSFPEATRLDAREIVYDDPFPEGVHINELQEATTDPEIRFCAACLGWLHSTGYLTGTQNTHCVMISQAVLTPKAFEAMAAMPTSLTQTSSAVTSDDGTVGQ